MVPSHINDHAVVYMKITWRVIKVYVLIKLDNHQVGLK